MLRTFSKFLLSFSFVRFVRSFFYNWIRPGLKYFYYFSLFTIIILLPYYSYRHRDELTIFRNRVINKYIGFLNKDKAFYKQITITGNKHTDYEEISAIINEEINNISDRSNPLDSVIKSIKNKIEVLPWIKNAVISRNLPNGLVVRIEEYEPFAIWQDEDKKFVIDKSGKEIIKVEDTTQFPNLLILSGKKANLNAESLFNILVIDLEISKNIYSATWVGFRRWDIRFNNDLLVKLPENSIEAAWKNLVKIYNMPGSLLNLRAIDLRVNNKIYLEYDDHSVEEIKSL